MIERYTYKEMGDIWSDENRYATWLKVELAVCRAWKELGFIPNEALKEIEDRSIIDIARVKQIEKETKHDVIAFLTYLAERIGPSSRFIHLGLTSSDVLDTAYAIQLKDSANIIIEALDQLLMVLKKRALEHKHTIMIGRSHGIHAEPISFGLKLAGFYAEFKRDRNRLVAAKTAVSRGKISGAVGTYAHLSPELEIKVMKNLDLIPAIGSTQVVARDGIANYFCVLAILGGGIERLAIEIRHLQRTEVLEVEEFFSKGQKGSSAMPHKRNPITCENLTGQARLLRSYAIAALENISLWHERDISHSSVERVIAPDANIITYYSLYRLADLIENLIVYPEHMLKNLHLTGGLIYSQRVLLALIEQGLTREDAYSIVQKNAMASWEEGGSFKDRLLNDVELTANLGSQSKSTINKFFDPWLYLKNLDYIFKQIFNE